MTTRVNRSDFERLQGITPKLIKFFEDLFSTGAANSEGISGAVEATGAIQNATVLVLSSNTAFTNERILVLDTTAFTIVDGGAGGEYTVTLASLIQTNGGFACTFNLAADTNLDLPVSGRVPSSADGPYADDAAAAAAGLAIGDIYRKTGGTVVWRQA